MEVNINIKAMIRPVGTPRWQGVVPEVVPPQRKNPREFSVIEI